jgi:uncharacterized membrane protein
MVMQKSSPKNFFTGEEKERIVGAIREAEKKTSGEIRVYLERRGKDDTLERAREIFQELGMTRTKQRNGVLIYLSLLDHRFAVLGDQGIYEKVGGGFWNDVVADMKSFFRRGEFAEGLRAAIHQVGEKLKTNFPWEGGDINELPDEV